MALALVVSAMQTRAAIQQTKLVAAQSKHVAHSLSQAAQTALTRNHADNRASFFRDDADLLAWYLASRGYPSSDYETNKRRLYVLTRMDGHQLNYMNYESGFIAEDFWASWKTVITTDLRIPEFVEIWPKLRGFYAPSFVRFCD